MTNEEKKDKLKSVLLKSYSEERMLTDTVTPHNDNLQQCLETIQNCQRLINSGKLRVLHHFRLRHKRCYHTMMQGEILSYHLRSKLVSWPTFFPLMFGVQYLNYHQIPASY